LPVTTELSSIKTALSICGVKFSKLRIFFITQIYS
jgi:hypothetical protein